MKNSQLAQHTIDWYDTNAALYTNKTAGRARHKNIALFSNSLAPGSHVLDVGCGPGRDTAILSEKGFDVTGLDLSAGLLTEARNAHPNLRFVQGSMTDLPFGDQSFDGIWANASLLHLPEESDVTQTLSEFYRVLKTGGRVFVYVKAQLGESDTEVVTDALSGSQRFFRYFTLPGLQQSLQTAGFHILSAHQYNESEDKLPISRKEVEWIVILAEKPKS